MSRFRLLRRTAAQAPAVWSPTGRNPTLLMTEERYNVLKQMEQENHPWWQNIVAGSDASLTSHRIDDTGNYNALRYQVTGNPQYAQDSYTRMYIDFLFATNGIDPGTNNVPGGRNTTREFFTEQVILFDWIYEGLTTEQRGVYIDFLNTWGDYVLGRAGVGGSTRTGDSDECVGHYGGLLLLDMATGALGNARAGGDEFVFSTFDDLTAGRQVGGYVSTFDGNWDYLTDSMRDALAYYASLFDGGCWIESCEYNLGTMKLVLMLIEASRTLFGVDHFPEYTALIDKMCDWGIQQMTTDLEQYFFWGDVEKPRDLDNGHRITLYGMLAGIAKNTTAGKRMNKMFKELVVKHVPGGIGGSTGSTGPLIRSFYFYDPYAEELDWRGSIALHSKSLGVGQFIAHSGRAATDSSLFVHWARQVAVDHQSNGRNFILYRNGAWAIMSPFGYGGSMVEAEACNSMLLASLSNQSTRDFDVGTAGTGWAYTVANSYGPHDLGHSTPSDVYCHEWTREIFWLQGGTCEAVVVFDRTNVEDPTTLTDPAYPEGYHPSEQIRIAAAPSLRQWIIHTTVNPTLGAADIAWTTEGAESARVDILLPASVTITAYDESVSSDLVVSDAAAVTGGAVLTSATGGFTAEMVGKQLIIYSGSGFAVSAYEVAGFTDTNTITLDRDPTNGSNASGGLIEVGGTLPEAAGFSNQTFEDAFQARVSPTVEATWVTFLNVVSVRSSGSITSTLIESSAGSTAQGALVQRTGLDDAVVMFGANQAARLHAAGFTFSWTQATASGKVYIVDLDPGLTWSYDLDSAGAAGLTVSADGVAELTVSGASSHTLVLTAA